MFDGTVGKKRVGVLSSVDAWAYWDLVWITQSILGRLGSPSSYQVVFCEILAQLLQEQLLQEHE